MITQSNLIAENDLKTNLITLNEVITEGKRITEDDKIFNRFEISTDLNENKKKSLIIVHIVVNLLTISINHGKN